MTSAIRAAGVVLVRTGESGEEFLVVHRPHRQDWSLPKGKLDAGEHVLAAAVRECDEESGYIPILQSPLPAQTYSVQGRPKVVNYWRARIGSEEEFAPDDEVAAIRWVPVDEAGSLLTYPSELDLVDAATSIPDTLPLVILRHTQAMKRVDFDGEVDSDRPLTGKGRSQAKQLATLLTAFGVDDVHSSSSRRCLDTVKRLARDVESPVQPEPLLSEEGHRDDPREAAARAVQLALTERALVVCTHRPVLPTLLDAMAVALGPGLHDERWRELWNPKLPPGGFIVVHRAFSDDGPVQVVGVERHTLGVDSA